MVLPAQLTLSWVGELRVRVRTPLASYVSELSRFVSEEQAACALRRYSSRCLGCAGRR